MDLNKTVIITGASRGIGRETARIFAENSYNVVINYNSSEAEAAELCRKLIQIGASAKIFKADVSNHRQVNEMIDFALREFGKIDVVVNNAGIAQTKLFTEITEEEWKRVIDVNLTGAFYCSQSVSKHMISHKSGKIINVSSIWGMTGASCEVHYSAAKAGIIGFTKALAKELGPSNIQVNCVAPGVIKTEILDEYSADDLKALEDETPLMRLGTPKDIAKVILFMASNDANFITGQVISPNGGFII